jgi:hypothetical protein
MCPDERFDSFIKAVKNNQELWSLILDREIGTREMDELTQSLGHRCSMAPDQHPDLSEPTKLQAIEDFVKNRLGKSDTELAAQIAEALRAYARRELALWFKQ